jgi:hypothetical protein
MDTLKKISMRNIFFMGDLIRIEKYMKFVDNIADDMYYTNPDDVDVVNNTTILRHDSDHAKDVPINMNEVEQILRRNVIMPQDAAELLAVMKEAFRFPVPNTSCNGKVKEGGDEDNLRTKLIAHINDGFNRAAKADIELRRAIENDDTKSIKHFTTQLNFYLTSARNAEARAAEIAAETVNDLDNVYDIKPFDKDRSIYLASEVRNYLTIVAHAEALGNKFPSTPSIDNRITKALIQANANITLHRRQSAPPEVATPMPADSPDDRAVGLVNGSDFPYPLPLTSPDRPALVARHKVLIKELASTSITEAQSLVYLTELNKIGAKLGLRSRSLNGGAKDPFYNKYLKYKSKYMKLRTELNM